MAPRADGQNLTAPGGGLAGVAVLDGEGEGWGGGAITTYAANHGQGLDACRGYGQPKGDTKAD